jgi:rhodanese-related sulfurtransferase
MTGNQQVSKKGNIMNKLDNICFYVGLVVCIFMFSGTATAKEMPLSPESIKGTTKVNAEGVIDLVEKHENLIMIDSRITADRKQGYIEGSIALPDIDTSCDSLAKIIPKKTSMTLFYCNGIKCGRSVKASKIAVGCGYSKLYWFRGGYAEWLEKGYPVVTKN